MKMQQNMFEQSRLHQERDAVVAQLDVAVETIRSRPASRSVSASRIHEWVSDDADRATSLERRRVSISVMGVASEEKRYLGVRWWKVRLMRSSQHRPMLPS